MTAWLRQRFTEEKLVNLTLAIVAINGWNKDALLCEWVQHAHPCLTKVCLVTGDDREIVDQGRRGNLFIQGVLWMWYAQVAPQLRDVCIDIQYKILVLAQQCF